MIFRRGLNPKVCPPLDKGEVSIEVIAIKSHGFNGYSNILPAVLAHPIEKRN